ncbi:MAG: nucleotidyltransferase domain-containing protein [Proteobacteria bacterium]|nr:nucleotidyltransferase domain-containing protein [Pseudomonadota bacterium]
MIIEKRHLKIIKEILSRYPYNFYAFGSRVNGNPRRFSDLDICFMDNILWNIRAHLDEDFEESDLPFKVDVVAWQSCSKDFQQAIQKDLLPL